MFDYPLTLRSGTHYSKLGVSPDASPSDISDAKGELVRSLGVRKRELEKRSAAFEKDAPKLDPEYRKIVSEMEQIDKKVNEINTIKLENQEERRKYDLETPPCALLKLSEFAVAVVNDRRTTLFNIRKELARFFEEEKQMSCYHPTDITRRFFTADYEYNPLLDEEKE